MESSLISTANEKRFTIDTREYCSELPVLRYMHRYRTRAMHDWDSRCGLKWTEEVLDVRYLITSRAIIVARDWKVPMSTLGHAV